MKKYYGIRFLGGNRTCTTGTPNLITGNMSIACDVQVFRSQADRNEWLKQEDLWASIGTIGGERIAVTKSQARKYKLGMSIAEFNEELEQAEEIRY